jgi:hypothetical protein
MGCGFDIIRSIHDRRIFLGGCPDQHWVWARLDIHDAGLSTCGGVTSGPYIGDNGGESIFVHWTAFAGEQVSIVMRPLSKRWPLE